MYAIDDACPLLVFRNGFEWVAGRGRGSSEVQSGVKILNTWQVIKTEQEILQKRNYILYSSHSFWSKE